MHEHMYQLLKRIWAQRAAYSLLLRDHFANHIMQLMLQVYWRQKVPTVARANKLRTWNARKLTHRRLCHWCLDAVANECLPIFLDEVVQVVTSLQGFICADMSFHDTNKPEYTNTNYLYQYIDLKYLYLTQFLHLNSYPSAFSPTSISILFSVTLVLIFGEIRPSAIFTGRNQLAISAFLAPSCLVVATDRPADRVSVGQDA
jgi:hypothetical protein